MSDDAFAARGEDLFNLVKQLVAAAPTHTALARHWDITEHVKTLEKMKGLKPSSSSLRKKALDKLVRVRRADLEKLAADGDRTARSLLT